jgi:hypothetical protein
MVEYKHFYIAIRRYINGKISRGLFLIDWKDAQRRQGIEAAERRGNRWQKK